MATFTLAHNCTVAKLIDAPADVVQRVSDLLSFRVDGADHIFSVNNGTWSGNSTFFETAKASFPAGFVGMVHEELKRLGHKVLLVRKPHATPLGPESPIVDEFGNDDPDYDFHMRALSQVEKYGRGIIQVATGGGKSKIAKLVMARFNRMTLFLTTRGILMYQMDRQLKAIGMQTGQIGDGEMRVVKGVNLGMVQTLAQTLEEPKLETERLAIIKSIHSSKKKDSSISNAAITELAKARFDEKTEKRNVMLKILEQVEVVIGEEAHEASGNSFFQILQNCTNASIRIALTATPFMKDSAEDNMRLMAAFGQKLIIISEKMLIQRGILATPYFKFVDAKPHDKLRKTSPWERAYQLGYLDNPFMHKEILIDALQARRVHLPVMTLIMRKAHGEFLQEMFTAKGLRAKFIKGETDMDYRMEQIERLGDGLLDVLIGTTILDVGVDVPAVGLVQLAGGYKAEVALRQRIGRGLRRKKNMANVAFVADYSCNLNSTLRDHYRQRRAVIEATPGFVENILPAGQDFDWSIFARKQAA